jgi:Rnl2 family RNA ligase
MEFQKYPKINSYCRKNFNSEEEFIVTEKIHGANFAFYLSENQIECAKRNSFLTPKNIFHNHQELLAKMRPTLEEILYSYGPMIIYGEIFGGGYPHPEIETNPEIKVVQKEVWYSPEVCFAAFDMMQNGEFLDEVTFQQICDEHDLFRAPILAQGTYDEVSNYDPAFETKIPTLLGLPSLPNNLAEGVVIKTTSGGTPLKRQIFKRKIKKYSEGRVKPPAKPKEDLSDLVERISPLINENRLQAVVSKDPYEEKPLLIRKKILAGLLIKDTFEEVDEPIFLKKKKPLMKELMPFATKIIHEYFS